MNPIFAAALEIQQLCRDRRWPFCIIGGIAVQRWGEPRLTRDVDISVLSGWGGEEPVIEAVLDRFAPRREDAREFALRFRVLLARASNDVPIDVALAAMPFEERATRRGSGYEIGEGKTLYTYSARDLVAFKVFAGRPQDWLYVEGTPRARTVGWIASRSSVSSVPYSSSRRRMVRSRAWRRCGEPDESRQLRARLATRAQLCRERRSSARGTRAGGLA